MTLGEVHRGRNRPKMLAGAEKGMGQQRRLEASGVDSFCGEVAGIEAHPTVVTSFAGVAWFVGGEELAGAGGLDG